MTAKIMVGSLLCVAIAMMLAFIFVGGGNSIESLVILLVPLSGFQMGVWMGPVIWIVGGGIGGLVIANYRRVFAMAAISIVLAVGVVMLILYQIDFLSHAWVDLGLPSFAGLLPDLLTAFAFTFIGGLFGVRTRLILHNQKSFN